MALEEQKLMRKIKGELLESQIIRQFDSEHASPVLLVKKENGEPRLCIDCTKLSSQTRCTNPCPE